MSVSQELSRPTQRPVSTAALADYRGSHATPGYAGIYGRTYEQGYYRAQWDRIERPLLERVLRREHEAGARRLIDFACGTGRITSVASEIFPDVTGVDVAAEMLEVARVQCPTARFECIDLTRQPFSAGADVVTAFRFFLNAEPGLRREALAAIRRILAPTRGALIANVHVNAASPLGLAYRLRNAARGRLTANALSPDQMTGLLADTGFAVESVEFYSVLPRIGWWFPRWLDRAMTPVERWGRKHPVVARRAQSFLVVGRPTG
jgi:SAM-dependent methyltransferase